MEELWKEVDGYDGEYFVSNTGKVKNSKDYIMKGGSTCHNGKTGYKFVLLSKNSKAKQFYIHRLVATAFLSNKNGLRYVNHIDGSKHNNSYSNLEWCTHAQNINHAIDKKLIPIGEDAIYSKLTQLEVDNIRYQIKNNYYRGIQRDLAIKYNVGKPAITNIKQGKTWRRSL